MRRDRQEAPLTRWPRLGQPGTRKLAARRPGTHVRLSLVDLQPLRAFATKPGQPGPVQVTTLRTSSVTWYYVTDTSAGSVSAGSRCGQRSSRLGETLRSVTMGQVVQACPGVAVFWANVPGRLSCVSSWLLPWQGVLTAVEHLQDASLTSRGRSTFPVASQSDIMGEP